MSSMSNMEKAKNQERWFWTTCGFVLLPLLYFTFVGNDSMEPGILRALVSVSPIFVVIMGGFTLGIIHNLKQEIADLKSGDADVSTATQDSE